MGMFTEFHFNSELRLDTPKEVINILEYMISNDSDKTTNHLVIPDHPLFSSPRWHWMLHGDSSYFSADTFSTLRRDTLYDYYDKSQNAYYLCIRCNFKNYDDEIDKFVDWIDPYLEKKSGQFLGFSRYEESEDPIIIKKK